jgi:hypothetical protein
VFKSAGGGQKIWCSGCGIVSAHLEVSVVSLI